MHVFASRGDVLIKSIPTQSTANGSIHLYYLYYVNNNYVVHKDHFHYFFLLHSVYFSLILSVVCESFALCVFLLQNNAIVFTISCTVCVCSGLEINFFTW